ncbi:ArnT family glycosyltransferase [Algoriphagus sp.]|uniref:ArnT family glycosyltransferase n=1 Tax=Algoriphagus sp. TaxID=1872435 RepID=UPI00391A6325
MIAFAVLVGPFALNFHMHYPDEIYYRDAAVKMLQNGDYLTTYLGSGELRFKKPILTYWAVLGGFQLFGVNEFGSRIFFLLSGAMTVGLTFWLGKTLFQNEKIAGISALIMAANPVLILASGRSIPDVLLVMTMTLSAVGFAGLLRYGNEAPKKYSWIMYLGLALAFEVKGLPAAALGVLGLLYLLMNPWKRISWKTLLNFPALAVSLFIALFWFVAMWKIHGPTYLDSFLEDQVGIRVASRLLLIFQNGLLALVLLIAMFIPWVLLVIPASKNIIVKCWKENAAFFGFAILWGLAILAMGAMTSKFYERYLLPVAPVLAVLLAWILVRGEFELRKNGLKLASILFLFIAGLILTVGIWLGIKGETHWSIWIQMVIAIMIFGYLIFLIKKEAKLPKVIAYTFLLIFFSLSTITYYISLPHQGTQVKTMIDNFGIDSDLPIAFVGHLHAGSKIRMSLGPEFNLIDLPNSGWENEISQFQNLIIEDRLLDSLDTSGFEVSQASVNWDSKQIPELLKLYGKSEFNSLLNSSGRKYYFLSRKSSM